MRATPLEGWKWFCIDDSGEHHSAVCYIDRQDLHNHRLHNSSCFTFSCEPKMFCVFTHQVSLSPAKSVNTWITLLQGNFYFEFGIYTCRQWSTNKWTAHSPSVHTVHVHASWHVSPVTTCELISLPCSKCKLTCTPLDQVTQCFLDMSCTQKEISCKKVARFTGGPKKLHICCNQHLTNFLLT